ncbi:MAG TPA: endonuclease III [Fibrobacteraceae bacterium]|nr:endonuclease III [Fibrobacteraceae bacterium]
MRKIDKVRFIQSTLDQLFPDPPIPLNHRDAYTLLVAVVLSAQCTDAMVNRVTPELFRRASTPQEMIRLDVEEIRRMIAPCGLSPTKARNIHALSQMLLERHGGEVPGDFSSLEALPGVGHKTASVVMIHAFQVPAFPVDTHIHRLASRWGLSDGSSVERTEKDLKRLFPKDQWEKIHLQMIYFGRKFCPARGHDPALCPICRVVG